MSIGKTRPGSGPLACVIVLPLAVAAATQRSGSESDRAVSVARAEIRAGFSTGELDQPDGSVSARATRRMSTAKRRPCPVEDLQPPPCILEMRELH